MGRALAAFDALAAEWVADGGAVRIAASKPREAPELSLDVGVQVPR